MMNEDDSIPEPILNLRKKSAVMHMRNFDSSAEERANNDRKRPHEGNGDSGNDSKILCQEVGLESNQDPPARERPAVCAFVFSFPQYVIVYAIQALTYLTLRKRTENGHNENHSALLAPLSFMGMDL